MIPDEEPHWYGVSILEMLGDIEYRAEIIARRWIQELKQ
jgi:hypothetical protein